jgi:integrase/recombinase XerD
MSVKVSIYHDLRSIRKKTGDYPYKLQVYAGAGKQKFYPTIFGLTLEEHKKLKAKNLGERLQEIRDKLRDIERSANEIAQGMDPFSFEQFELEFLKDHPMFDQVRIKFKPLPPALKQFDFSPFHNRFKLLLLSFEPGTIGEVFQLLIKHHLSRNTLGSIKTAVGYQTTGSSFLRFAGSVPFKTVTVEFLRLYADWLKTPTEDKKKTCNKTTTGIYMRRIRTVFNEAIRLKRIKKENCYPFGRGKYVIPGSQNIKKALDMEDIGRIYYYPNDPAKPAIQRAKSFWFFMYFGQGMNPKDVVLLQYKNIEGEYLQFVRAKTEETIQTPPVITVYLTEDMLQTIADYGNPGKKPENYIFPVLEHGMTALRQVDALELFIASINKWFQVILDNLGIDKKAGCQVARHSFATARRLGGADLLDIGEDLGHMDPRTTRRYVGSLPCERKKGNSAQLEAFKIKRAS